MMFFNPSSTYKLPPAMKGAIEEEVRDYANDAANINPNPWLFYYHVNAYRERLEDDALDMLEQDIMLARFIKK